MEQAQDLKSKTDEFFASLNPLQHLRKLNFPRRAGTDGEQKAAEYIAQVLEQSGIEPSLQEFHYPRPKPVSKIIPPLIFLTWIVLSLINIRYLDNNLIISIIVLVLPLVIILALLNFGRLMRYLVERRINRLKKTEGEFKDGSLDLDQVITSRNVIAEIGAKDAAQEILFTAHFDSISSKIIVPEISSLCLRWWQKYIMVLKG